MEHIKDQLQNLKLEKVQERPSSLIPYSSNLKLQEEEIKIVAIKYAAPQICKLSTEQVSLWSKALLIKIHVITGWVIPEDTSMMNILVEQFEKHLSESFGMLNTEEIEYAFRTMGTTIEDWGKNMNLNLTDKVLLKYVEKRFNASEAERKAKETVPVQKIYTDEEIVNMRRKELELAYQGMLKGRVPTIYDYFGELLVEDGFIENRVEIYDFFSRCLGSGVEHLYTNE